MLGSFTFDNSDGPTGRGVVVAAFWNSQMGLISTEMPNEHELLHETCHFSQGN